MGWWYSGKHDSEGIQFPGWQWQIFWNPVSDGRIADQGRNVSGRDVVHVCACMCVGIISELCSLALSEIL